MNKYRYYLTNSQAVVGTCPVKPNFSFINFEERRYVTEIGREVWGILYYVEPLTPEEIEDYQLIQPFEQCIMAMEETEQHKWYTYYPLICDIAIVDYLRHGIVENSSLLWLFFSHRDCDMQLITECYRMRQRFLSAASKKPVIAFFQLIRHESDGYYTVHVPHEYALIHVWSLKTIRDNCTDGGAEPFLVKDMWWDSRDGYPFKQSDIMVIMMDGREQVISLKPGIKETSDFLDWSRKGRIHLGLDIKRECAVLARLFGYARENEINIDDQIAERYTVVEWQCDCMDSICGNE